jgi:hypothetical protein
MNYSYVPAGVYPVPDLRFARPLYGGGLPLNNPVNMMPYQGDFILFLFAKGN